MDKTIDHRLDQRARREVLAGAGLDVLRVALQQHSQASPIADQFSASIRSTITRRSLAWS